MQAIISTSKTFKGKTIYSIFLWPFSLNCLGRNIQCPKRLTNILVCSLGNQFTSNVCVCLVHYFRLIDNGHKGNYRFYKITANLNILRVSELLWGGGGAAFQRINI